MEAIKGSINIISGGSVNTDNALKSYEETDTNYDDYQSEKEFKLTGAGTSQSSAIKLKYSKNGKGTWYSTFDAYKNDLDFGYTTNDNIKSISVTIWLGLDKSWQLRYIDNVLGVGGVYSTIIGKNLDLYNILTSNGINKTTLEVVYSAKNSSGKTIKSLSRYIDVSK